MANIELVVKIPEEMFESIKIGMRYKDDVVYIMNQIENSTPLPKGHGKLIAEPTEEEIAKTIGGKNDFAECIRDAVRIVYVNAPTIIEADKESEE